MDRTLKSVELYPKDNLKNESSSVPPKEQPCKILLLTPIQNPVENDKTLKSVELQPKDTVKNENLSVPLKEQQSCKILLLAPVKNFVEKDKTLNSAESQPKDDVKNDSSSVSYIEQPSFSYVLLTPAKNPVEKSKNNAAKNPVEISKENKAVIKVRKTKHRCPECKETFSKVFNLRRHISRKHPSQLPKLFPPKVKFKCSLCEKSFNCMNSVRTHRRRHHNLYLITRTHKCPLCPEEYERKDFAKHFESSHDLLLDFQKLNFDSYEEFCIWKKTMERETKSYFTKEASKAYKEFTRHFFICHRSGSYRCRGSEGKRKLKKQGSKKIDAYCPATLKVIVFKEKNCEVVFQSEHVGHDNELKHLNLTFEERQIIATKLASNLPFDVILNDIRNSVSEDNPRLRLLKRKDLHNIKKSFLKNGTTDFHLVLSEENMSKNLSDISNRHFASKHLKAEVTNLENGWMLTSSENNEMYFIKENQTTCNCPLICSYCNACIQSYTCSCPDSSTKGNMCKHIHFLCTIRNSEKVSDDSSDENDSLGYTDLIELTRAVEENVDGNVLNEPSEIEKSVISTEISLEKRNELRKKMY